MLFSIKHFLSFVLLLGLQSMFSSRKEKYILHALLIYFFSIFFLQSITSVSLLMYQVPYVVYIMHIVQVALIPSTSIFNQRITNTVSTFLAMQVHPTFASFNQSDITSQPITILFFKH